MSKRNQNFSLHRGESKVVFIDLDDVAGSPFNPAGCSMEWALTRSAFAIDEDDEILVQKSLGYGLEVATGGVNIALDSEDTFLTPGFYYHELKVFLPAGAQSMSCTGTVNIRPALDLRPRPILGADASVVAGAGTVT